VITLPQAGGVRENLRSEEKAEVGAEAQDESEGHPKGKL